MFLIFVKKKNSIIFKFGNDFTLRLLLFRGVSCYLLLLYWQACGGPMTYGRAFVPAWRSKKALLHSVGHWAWLSAAAFVLLQSPRVMGSREWSSSGNSMWAGIGYCIVSLSSWLVSATASNIPLVKTSHAVNPKSGVGRTVCPPRIRVRCIKIYFSSTERKNWDQSFSSPHLPKIFVVTSHLSKTYYTNFTAVGVIFVSFPLECLYLFLSRLLPHQKLHSHGF